jgi:hypothetical protein
VYQIMQAHEGKVWARSKAGQGTTFILRLHRMDAARPAEEGSKSGKEKVSSSRSAAAAVVGGLHG